MDFKQFFDKTDNAVKLQFLKDALQKNDALRNQFTRYCESLHSNPKKKVQEKPLKTISEACEKLNAELESLDFEDMDWRNYVPRHSGYIEDYEAYENFAEDQLNEILDAWKNNIGKCVNNGELELAVCQCLGSYDACWMSNIKGSADIFEDMTETLFQHHQEVITETVDAMDGAVKSEEQAILASEAILNHFLEKYQETSDFLRYFEPLLISLTETTYTAETVVKKLETSGIDESLAPRLAVKLASFDNDPLIWREKAEEFMEADLEVAKQLLDHYWTEDPECFRLVGKKLFGEHRRELCDFFSERLYPMFDEEFYKEVLRFKTLRDRDIDLYESLREYLNEEEKQRFIDDIDWDMGFRINILSIEKKFSEILRMAQKDVLHTWHFTELIIPILNIYPAEVMELIRIKCADTLTNHKKRSGYQRISEWLRLSLQINGMEEEARHLIHDLYNRRPALPALKDEMRKAGVIAV
ncbi:MAG: hypothetical protein HQ542_03625 [Bacteroidia bacterium]|nr:hypothetical protein [Bacteroidia bacterium]